MRDIGREGEREGVHDGEDRIREDRKGCWDRDRKVRECMMVWIGREDRKGCWDRDKGVKKSERVHDGVDRERR